MPHLEVREIFRRNNWPLVELESIAASDLSFRHVSAETKVQTGAKSAATAFAMVRLKRLVLLAAALCAPCFMVPRLPRPAPRTARLSVSSANSALFVSASVAQLALHRAALPWFLGSALHVLVTTLMRRLRCPTVPESFRRDARANLAKSYIAQAILLAVAFTSQRETSALVAQYLFFALILFTSVLFDWPTPPLLEQAPALVFPGGGSFRRVRLELWQAPSPATTTRP